MPKDIRKKLLKYRKEANTSWPEKSNCCCKIRRCFVWYTRGNVGCNIYRITYIPVSDIASRCNVGNQTRVCGSSIIQSKNSCKLILPGMNAYKEKNMSIYLFLQESQKNFKTANNYPPIFYPVTKHIFLWMSIDTDMTSTQLLLCSDAMR